MDVKFLRRKEVESITGLKRSSIYAKMTEGNFPTPIKIGLRSVAWLESDIKQWMDEKVYEHRSQS